ncbi:hypothetical protein J6590_086730 [Homalodisca vitripennis]|nr:hypothetical protein J6590_086730 [Homalodisca vitripennis]
MIEGDLSVEHRKWIQTHDHDEQCPVVVTIQKSSLDIACVCGRPSTEYEFDEEPDGDVVPVQPSSYTKTNNSGPTVLALHQQLILKKEKFDKDPPSANSFETMARKD